MTSRQNILYIPLTMLVAGLICLTQQAPAQVRTQALQELAEALVRRPAPGWTGQMATAENDDLGRLGTRHGDELAVAACRKASPLVVTCVFRAVGQEGEKTAVKLLVRRGDSDIWMIKGPRALATFVKFGDEAG